MIRNFYNQTYSSRAASFKVLLVYPNTGEVAFANLGFQRVYALLNRLDGVVCDRWAMSGADERPSPRQYDMIAFSIAFEPDYLRAVEILEDFGIPFAREERGNDYPLIAAGGSAVFINPEPLADICDVMFIGEAEGMVEAFFPLAKHGGARGNFLRQAALLPGIYVPQFYLPVYTGERLTGLISAPGIPPRVRRHRATDPAEMCTHSEIHGGRSAAGGASVFKDMALMEVTRGCIWACRFCTAGFIYRPPRLPDLARTYESLSRLLSEQGSRISTIGLVGPSVTDHPGLMPLARKIVAEGRALSFSSLRMETLDDEWVDLILQSGQKTITLAIDGSSERMRRVVNKTATDEIIVDTCRRLTEKGVLHLKIYSIIGLPGETEDDIDAFIRLMEKIAKAYVAASSRRGDIGHLTVAVSPLAPKPGTPFQWHPLAPVEVLKKRFMKLRQALGRLPNVKLSFGSPHEVYLQTYLSRGDRRVLDFFKAYLANGRGAKRALKSVKPHPDGFVYRQYERDDVLPWNVIDHGYENQFLWEDYRRALKEKPTPVCDTRRCKLCGVC